jgi:hypothetical protein
MGVERRRIGVCFGACVPGVRVSFFRKCGPQALGTGIANLIRVRLTAVSPGPSLAGRASLPSRGMGIEEIHFAVPIPTPDPTEH